VTDITFRPQTSAAVEAVGHALDLARQASGRADVTPKAGRDIVTSTDIAVEDAIRARLAASTGLPLVGEEQGGEVPPDGSAYWLVDPVCGTRNYAVGTTLYSINVALAERGKIIAAIVGDPSVGEILVAETGQGAWARPAGESPGESAGGSGGGRWRPLRTSDASQTVAIEPARSAGPRRFRAAALIANIIRADNWEFRSLGSTLSMAYLAAGRLAAWAVFWTDSAVHCAAGSLLVTEAGGVVSDLDGADWTVDSDSCLASAHAGLHADLLELLA
jgi:myo-inositol-1(or 4)-monophosphatase